MTSAEAPTSGRDAAGLVAAMLVAQAGQRSGVFEVLADGARTHVYFEKGKVVFAEQGTLGDTLGRVLVREGKLTNEQYAAAIRQMTEQLVESEQMRFGEVVIELGFLKVEEVQEALVAQVRQKAIRCLMYEAPEWLFREASERSKVAHYPSSVEPLVLAATRLFEEERLHRLLHLDEDRYPRLLGDVEAIALRFEMGAAGRRFLSLLDSARSARGLVGDAHPELADASAVLSAIVLTGDAELRSEPIAAKAPALPDTHPPVVPAPVAAAPPPAQEPPTPKDETPAAHPRIEPRRPLIRVRPRAARLAAAAAKPEVPAPSPFDPRVQPFLSDPHAARLVAEGEFQKAKVHLRSYSIGQALPELRRAAELCPSSMEFVLHLKWAESLTSTDEAARPALRAALKSFATRATRQDPNFAFGFFVLGQLALLEEEPKRAVRLFMHALRLDPDMVDAERHLRIARSREAGRKSGSAFVVPLDEPKNAAVDAPAPAARAEAEVAEPAKAAVAAEAAPATPPTTPAPPEPEPPKPAVAHPAAATPTPSRTVPVLLAVLALGIVAGGAVIVFSNGDDSSTPAPSARPQDPSTAKPAPSPSTPSMPATTAPPAPDEPTEASPATSASATAPVATAAQSASAVVDRTTGTVVTSASAAGHRIFVDGRVVGEAPAPLRVPCGTHVLKVGSSGKEKSVLVPCGGSVDLEP